MFLSSMFLAMSFYCSHAWRCISVASWLSVIFLSQNSIAIAPFCPRELLLKRGRRKYEANLFFFYGQCICVPHKSYIEILTARL